jgi:lipopolysaccharide exporter
MPPLRSRLGWVLNPGNTLSNRAANAGFWAFLLALTIRLLRTARAFLLARLIAPDDWGLMGIALLVVELITSFSQTGITSALIQRKGKLEREEFDTAWTIEAIRGLGLTVIVILAAPLAASLFQNPDATNLLRLMGLGLAIKGMANTGVVDFDRDLEFQRRFVYRTLPHLVEFIVAVSLALILRNAWAMAFGWLAGVTTFTISSFLVHGHRPRLRFVPAEARRMLAFGKWIFGSKMLMYGLLHLDDIIVARVGGAASLAFYQMAYTMSQLAASEITNVTYTVAFPAYSSLQDEPTRLSKAYLRTVQLVALLAFPLTVGIWFIGPEFVDTILGTQWQPLLPALGILLVLGLIRAITGAAEPLLQGIGRPGVITRNRALQLAILAVLIYPMTNEWGIQGAAWATAIAGVMSIWPLVVAGKSSAISWSGFGRAVGLPALNSALMLAALIGTAGSGLLPKGGWTLVWAPLLGIAVYFGLVLACRRFFGYMADGAFLGGFGKEDEKVTTQGPAQ